MNRTRRFVIAGLAAALAMPAIAARSTVASLRALVVVPSARGKAVGCIVPSLLAYKNEIVSLDIKGHGGIV